MSNAPLATGASRDLIGTGSRKAGSDLALKLRVNSEYVAIPLLALAIAAALFALFLLAIGKSPVDFVSYVWRGGFGTAFSFQNTLQRSAPLILTALAVAIPARIGLIMIGGEGALVLGGFVAAAVAIPMIGVVPPLLTLPIMVAFAMIVGAFWVGLAGFLRYARGVNETISSLLLTYIGIAIMNFFVEGVLRDVSNPNKPSTKPLGDAYMVGKIPGTDVHWGFAVGILLCIALYFLLERTTFGFAARVTGGNFRAALAQGLPVGRLIVACSRYRRRLRRARRLLRSGGDPGPRERFARGRLWLHRHSRLVPGSAQSARHSAGRDPVWRHRRRRRSHPAAHGSPRRDRAGSRGPDLRCAADLRDALRPVLDLQAARRE